MKNIKLKFSKFFPSTDYGLPSFLDLSGEGTDKDNFNISLAISTGKDMVNIYLGDYDKANFKFVQELHSALTKALDYYETMAQIAVVTNPAIPVVSKKTKGVLKSTETKPKK